MKKLIRNFAILLSVLLILCCIHFGIFFACVPAQYADSYNAALIDKTERLEHIDRPKIILVGDSNLAYGMDSQLLEEEIGMPVVNMGLHGGLGNKFLERAAMLKINEGDLVVVCHSNYADNDELKQADLAWITLENHWKLWKIPDAKMWTELMIALPDYTFNAISLYLSGRGNQNTNEIYAREAFNKWGDNIGLREAYQYEIDEDTVSVPKISDECAKRINELNDYCESIGAKLVIAGYPILVGENTPDKEEYTAFQDELEAKIKCKVISDYTDYFFTVDYFFDGCLHMTNEGAVLRTKQLIRDINEFDREIQ